MTQLATVAAQVGVPGAAQMRALGARLASLLRSGDLVVLTGQLGAGKTTLAQGIGAGLGVRGPVTSPTFVIARRHPSLGDGPALVHADAYRLGSRIEVDDLDLDADLDSSVTVVEWGEGLVEDLAPDHLQISIDRGSAGGPGSAGGLGSAGGPGSAGGLGSADGPGSVGGLGSADGLGDLGSADELRSAGGLSDDELRLVTVTGHGDRWRIAAAALRAALAEPANPLV